LPENAEQAAKVYVGAFVNAAALCRKLAAAPLDIAYSVQARAACLP
jgi:hypothetical protein